mmetsp:Transcript_46556/g.151244  ORF Transcript_46556/g.151244 Transcript_46556/m.151244 type:complete len:137 (-) Transcript_46556:311-721(-)
MEIFFGLVLLVLLAPTGEALASPGAALRLRTPLRTAPATMQIFGKKKEKIPTLEERGYWAGEWVCADCGYIYEPDPKDPFEELPPYWKCPQCAGPRRRFIKKAGDVLGKLDDTPMTAFIGVCFAAIAYLVYVAIST